MTEGHESIGAGNVIQPTARLWRSGNLELAQSCGTLLAEAHSFQGPEAGYDLLRVFIGADIDTQAVIARIEVLTRFVCLLTYSYAFSEELSQFNQANCARLGRRGRGVVERLPQPLNSG